MDRDSPRLLRLRWDDRRDPGVDRNRLRSPAANAPAARGAPRFVGRVFDGGAIPNQIDRIYLVHPVRFDGAEAEGGSATPIVDDSRAIPVVVVGSRAPEAGDLLIAVSVGGRWVGDRGGAPPPGWDDADDPEEDQEPGGF